MIMGELKPVPAATARRFRKTFQLALPHRRRPNGHAHRQQHFQAATRHSSADTPQYAADPGRPAHIPFGVDQC